MGLRAPHLPFAIPAGIGTEGVESVVPELPGLCFPGFKSGHSPPEAATARLFRRCRW